MTAAAPILLFRISLPTRVVLYFIGTHNKG